jgi:hypothetical protein
VGTYDDSNWNVVRGRGHPLSAVCITNASCMLTFNHGTSQGRVLSSCKIKLLDWEEGNYRNADAENPAIGMPRGEARPPRMMRDAPCVASIRAPRLTHACTA